MNSKQCAMVVGGAVLFATIGYGVHHFSSRKGEERVGLFGTVTLRGEPVVVGNIQFTPDATTSGPAALGKIENGKYDIPHDEGVFPGNYHVEVTVGAFTTKEELMRAVQSRQVVSQPKIIVAKKSQTIPADDESVKLDFHLTGQ
jgi:hypothetical protein